jgi:hypothetical protein
MRWHFGCLACDGIRIRSVLGFGTLFGQTPRRFIELFCYPAQLQVSFSLTYTGYAQINRCLLSFSLSILSPNFGLLLSLDTHTLFIGTP